MALNPNDLSDLAKCFCFNKKHAQQAMIYLLCKWANAGSAPAPCDLPNKPTSPTPASGGTGVSPDSPVLSWMNGGGATSYNVWFNGSFVGTTVGTTFNPGVLAYSSSYTWRVDAVNSCGTTTGDTWTFSTIIPLPNKPTTPNPANGATGVSINPTLSWVNGGGATSYDVWFNGAFIGNQAGTTYAPGPLTNNTAYSWRIDAVNGGGTTTGDTWGFTTIVAAPNKPTTPSPTNGATDVLPYAPVLSWANGGGATSYDVYFNGSFIGNQAGTTYAPGALSFNTAYSWRIDAVNAGGTTTGDTWSFTTIARFSYAPSSSTITWTDGNGAGQTGNLAFFDANADLLSVSSVNLDSQSITSISNLKALPALAYLSCSTNSLTVLNLSGCSNLASLYCHQNSLTTVDINPCPLLTVLDFQVNELTVLAVNTILSQLVTFGLTGGQLELSPQTPAAPPSVGPPNGIAAKAALLAEIPAWAVTTD